MSALCGWVVCLVCAGMVWASLEGSAEAQPAAGEWAVPLAGEWAAQPDQVRESERPRRLIVVDGPEAPAPPGPAFSARADEGSASFEVVGRAPERRTMRWQRSVPARDLAPYTHATIRYRAKGLGRSHNPLPIVALVGKDTEGKPVTEPLLDAAHLFNDGLWHTVVAKRKGALVVDAVQVQVTTEDSLASFDLGTLTLHTAIPQVRADLTPLEPLAAVRGSDLQPLDLGAQYNDTCAAALARVLESEGLVTDGAAALDPVLSVAGIPFRTGSAAKNLIRPAESRAADNEPVEVLGIKTTRHYFRPPGRDDAVEVPVGKKVSEAFLLLVCELPKGGPRYATTRSPRDFADIGALSIELRYADGESDLAFPYSLSDGGYALQRMVGAYAVPADPGRVLERVVIHNHVFGRTFSLAALTVNTSERRVLPRLAAEPALVRPLALAPPPARAPYIRHEGDRLRLGNGFYEVTVNVSRGFAIEKLIQRWSKTEIALDPSSGLEVEKDGTVLTGRAFRTEAVEVSGNTATVTLQSAHAGMPLKLALSLGVDATPQLRLGLEARNTGLGPPTPPNVGGGGGASTGATPLAATLRFPAVRGLRVGSLDETWIYFPGYRSIATDRPALFTTPNDRSFCVQFLDAYNPRAGVGVGVLTRDRENASMRYTLGKSDRGVSAWVEYPGEYRTLAPGETTRLPEAVLLTHAGDWHAAMDAYRDWLKTWYRPVQSQDKEWFRRLFLMRIHLTKKVYSWAIPFYDPEKREYRVDPFLKVDRDYWGMLPEMLHLGGWYNYDDSVGGDFRAGDYAVKDYTGGAEVLRGTVRKLQEEHGIPVSLYMIPDRASKKSEAGQRLGEKLARRREDGSVVHDVNNWYLCPAAKEWQDHYVEAVRRTQRETGVKAIYVDVFGYSEGHRCYSREHGHEVPTRVNEASLALIRRLREALPPDVALWSEYPVNDASAQYLDGNIHYYCLEWYDFFGKRYDGDGRAAQGAPFAQSALRYAFPHLRQFIFLCGSQNWTADSRFPFFNGEPLYDTSWFLYAGPHLERMRKSLALQRRYADCFASAAPVPDVPTERAGIHANAFPGEGRTLWTLYSARFTTVRAPMLAVPHVKDATYRDAWNDRVLTPRIVDGKAILSLSLHPQEVGCLVQERK